MSGLEGLLAGRTLVKRYRIQEVIGRGGFAAVYKAEDERLGRPVAVKIITLPASDEDAREHLRERLQREARAAASLPQHPNVVTVHDFGRDPELGLDFLVMELLHGEDLATHLARNRKLPPADALRILRDAIEGVAVGHRADLMHRDIKPGNIFLAEPHGEDAFRVCVLDFGIARVASAADKDTRLTKTGIPLSPAYASPEQLRGVRDLSCASDVFSLGVVAFQLLSGEKPLRADRTTDPADWSPDRGLRELNPEVPPAVEEVVRRAMAFDPVDRYPDAGAMAQALDSATMGPVDETVRLGGAGAVLAAGLGHDDAETQLLDDERTLLHTIDPAPPVTTTPPPPPATPVRAAVPAGAGGKRSTGKWVAILAVAALVTVAGLWALSRGSGGDGSGNRDIVIEDPAAEVSPTGSSTRITGEIIEDVPAVDPQLAAPPAADTRFPDLSQPRPGVSFPQPSAPQTARPTPAQPGQAGLPPVTPPSQTQPAAPASQQAQPVQPAQPAPARPDTTGPRLLGTPVERPAPAPAPAPGNDGTPGG